MSSDVAIQQGAADHLRGLSTRSGASETDPSLQPADLVGINSNVVARQFDDRGATAVSAGRRMHATQSLAQCAGQAQRYRAGARQPKRKIQDGKQIIVG